MIESDDSDDRVLVPRRKRVPIVVESNDDSDDDEVLVPGKMNTGSQSSYIDRSDSNSPEADYTPSNDRSSTAENNVSEVEEADTEDSTSEDDEPM